MKRITQLVVFLCIHLLYSQQKEYELFTTSVNSEYADFGVTYTNNNKVLFASSKKNENDISFKKNRRLNNRQLYLELYSGLVDERGDIIETTQFKHETNNKYFESDITFSPDLKTVYFTWNNFYNTQKRIDSAKWQTLRIVKASFNDNFKIMNTSPLPFNSSEYSVRSPELSKDGKQLYFISDMPGGYGEMDIYVVDILPDGTYSTPENLGPNVNTKQAEMFPFIDEKNTLYFSSYGHKGKGRLDIYKSEFKDGDFQKAKNLPKPINSKFDDFAFVINNSTNSGFITSTRDGGKGGTDIYAFKIKDKEVVCNQLVTGSLYNKNNGQQLENVQITISYKNKIIETKTIQKKKAYQFNLKCNESYIIVAEKENFKSAEIEIITDNTFNTEITKNISLTPLKCTQIIAGIVLDSETDTPISDVKVSLFHNNTLNDTKTIANGSKFNFELECGKDYKIVAEKENFKSAEIDIITDNTFNAEITKNISLTPIDCTQLLTGVVLDKATKNPLPNALVTIYKNNALIETVNLNIQAIFEFEMECGSNYRIVVMQKDYRINTSAIQASGIFNDRLNRQILLDSDVEFVTIGIKKMVKINTVNFDLNKSTITNDMAIELNKVVEVLLKYPNLKIEIESHTDSRAPDNYNMTLSNERVNSTMAFIISKGIDPNRVSGSGYGETKLLNKCANGIKCTDSEHKLNRRTEFIVIEN